MDEGVQGMSVEMVPGPAPQLGLVCITHSEAVRYRALTAIIAPFACAGFLRLGMPIGDEPCGLRWIN